MNKKFKRSVLAYTAGIIDGEGCVAIEGFNSKTSCFRVVVTVANTNEWLVNWLKFAYGGSIVYCKPKSIYAKASFQWRIRTRQAVEFLKLILPYLVLKRPQAELAIKFQQKRFIPGGHNRKTDKQWILDEADKILMAKYNKRGV